jgi:hypothetical protein
VIRTDVVWFVGKIMVPANFAKVWLRHLPKQLQIIGDKGANSAFFTLVSRCAVGVSLLDCDWGNNRSLTSFFGVTRVF